MRLRLESPAIASIACDDCKKWVYDMKTGKRTTYQCGSQDNVVPTKRPGPPPCKLGWQCPKGCPENERLFKLAVRNIRMWETFLEKRANRLPPSDRLQVEAFTKLEFLMAAHERQNLAIAIASMMVR